MFMSFCYSRAFVAVLDLSSCRNIYPCNSWVVLVGGSTEFIGPTHAANAWRSSEDSRSNIFGFARGVIVFEASTWYHWRVAPKAFGASRAAWRDSRRFANENTFFLVLGRNGGLCTALRFETERSRNLLQRFVLTFVGCKMSNCGCSGVFDG